MNQIRFAYYEPKITFTETKAIEANRGRKFWRLQKALLHLAKKCGAKTHVDENISYDDVTIDTEKLEIFNTIFDQIKHLKKMGTDPKYILMGHRHYRMLMDTIRDPFKNTIAITLPQGVLFGMKLILVPWMDGILVMDDYDTIA